MKRTIAINFVKYCHLIKAAVCAQVVLIKKSCVVLMLWGLQLQSVYKFCFPWVLPASWVRLYLSAPGTYLALIVRDGLFSGAGCQLDGCSGTPLLSKLSSSQYPSSWLLAQDNHLEHFSKHLKKCMNVGNGNHSNLSELQSKAAFFVLGQSWRIGRLGEPPRKSPYAKYQGEFGVFWLGKTSGEFWELWWETFLLEIHLFCSAPLKVIELEADSINFTECPTKQLSTCLASFSLSCLEKAGVICAR